MELAEAVRRRRMVRTFSDEALPATTLERVLEAGRRGPSAGNAQGLDLLVLAGADEVAQYWEVTMPDPAVRARFRWQGLVTAPVLVVPVVSAGAYARRYDEGDKATTGLGDEEAWPVPYWFVDGGMAVQLLLLAAVDEGLGACFFGIFDHEVAVRSRFGIPDDRRLLGTVALGHPAPDEPGRSVVRPRRPLDDVVHRGAW